MKPMTVQEHFDRYGAMSIVDKDDAGNIKKAFHSSPAHRAVGGIVKAGDFKALGIF